MVGGVGTEQLLKLAESLRDRGEPSAREVLDLLILALQAKSDDDRHMVETFEAAAGH